MSAAVIAIANQKGGVGKTTTAVNLATGLAAVGHPVLLIDADYQGNATTNLGIDKSTLDLTTDDVLFGGVGLAVAARPTAVPNLHLVPASVDLAGADLRLATVSERERRLHRAIQDVRALYDFIIIDCPPALSLITVNALTAADKVLVPLQAEFLALEGLAHLVSTIDLVRASYNPDLSLLGIVLTMVDRRNRLSDSVERDVRDYFRDVVFQTVIPRNVRVSESSSHGMPVLLYDLKCSGSAAYMDLAKEVLRRCRTLEPA